MRLFDFLFRWRVKSDLGSVVRDKLPSDLSTNTQSPNVEIKVFYEDPRPTEKQLAYARDLGLSISSSMNRNEVSQLIGDAIKRKKPPADWQLKSATKFGIEVLPDMSFGQLQDLIDQAEFNKPPTHQQLKKAKAYGISFPSDLTYGQLAKLLDDAAPNQPATADQLRFCERLGIDIEPGTTRGAVDKIITDAVQNPRYDDQFQKIADEDRKDTLAEEDREFREKYGDDLIDALNQWEKILDDTCNKFLIIFRRGKQVVVEVVELNTSPYIVETKSPYIQLSFLFPIKEKFGQEYSLEWEKEVNIRATNVLHIERIDRSLSECDAIGRHESEDLLAYKSLIERGHQLSRTLESS